MADDQTHAAAEKVLRYANSLGLHGLIIMSFDCPTCGDCHNFSLYSDLPPDATADLVEHYVGVLSKVEPVHVAAAGGSGDH